MLKNFANLTIKKPKGRPDIFQAVDTFKKSFNLLILDGSLQSNRRYAWAMIQKIGIEKTLNIIDFVSKHDFWRDKITSFSQLYYKCIYFSNMLPKTAPKPIVIDMAEKYPPLTEEQVKSNIKRLDEMKRKFGFLNR